MSKSSTDSNTSASKIRTVGRFVRKTFTVVGGTVVVGGVVVVAAKRALTAH